MVRSAPRSRGTKSWNSFPPRHPAADAEKQGNRPAASREKVADPTVPPDYNEETPKFCLHFLGNGFDVHAPTAQRQAAFVKTLQKLAFSRWKDLLTAPRHGLGTEHILAGQFKARIPARFQSEPRFMVFRYDGKLPMAGVRVRDAYHVLWIEPEFNACTTTAQAEPAACSPRSPVTRWPGFPIFRG